MGYCPYQCVLCDDEEDNGWGNDVSDEFKQILIDKGYELYGRDVANQICNKCLRKIIMPNEVVPIPNFDGSDNENSDDD